MWNVATSARILQQPPRSSAIPRSAVAGAPRAVTSGAETPRAAIDAEERALLERLKGGDASALDGIVRRYVRRAYALAYRVMGHREDAEDLVQESFLAVLERIETFDLDRPFGPWFFRIVWNRGMNARKSRAVRRTELVPDDVGDDQASAHDLVERGELRRRLEHAVADLPERQRTIVHLVDVDGFDSGEIAAMLHISPVTVRWHLHQARATLRRVLGPWRDEENEHV